MPQVFVSFLPDEVDVVALPGSTCVVMDVLRATTTITYALAAGASRVIACGEVDEARRLAERLPRGSALLAGERHGLLIPGFDLASSPDEFTPERVRGRTIVFTTTNGTRAMMRCRRADEVLLGAFTNLSAVCRAVASVEQLRLVCAGTNGNVTREDVLLAGAIVDRLVQAETAELDDEAQIARACWRDAVQAGNGNAGMDDGPIKQSSGAAGSSSANEWLYRALHCSRGGRNVVRLGLERDIRAAAAIDRYALVPRFDRTTQVVEPLAEPLVERDQPRP